MPEYANRFASPTFFEETILDREGGVVGIIRIKPSSVLWKPRGEHKYYSVSLERFADWITSGSCDARRTTS
jgi:hypothetical protein